MVVKQVNQRFKMTNISSFLRGCLVAMLLFSMAVSADSNTSAVQQSGVELLNRIDRLYRSDSATAKMTMQVVTPKWQRQLSLETWSQGLDKTFIRILSPKKDRGVATLKIDKDMWNYFPKINKSIKVPPSMMSGSWMGSDFSNDDLVRESSLVEDYVVTQQAENGHIVLLLEPKPDTVTVWGSITIKVNAESLLPVEQAYFDDRGQKIRVMSFDQIKQFGDRSLPSRMTMTPLNKMGHKTIMIYDNLNLSDQVDDSIFTQRNLKRRL